MEFEQLKQKAHELPKEPGVYIMRDSVGEVIYVGKAKALKNRVSQYFANLASHSEKTRQMVSRIDSFETIFAPSEFEALLLENTLIKKYKPKYNILLKDDKGYPFIAIPRADYPKLTIVNTPKEMAGVEYYGPYGARGAAKAAIETLGQVFGLPTCGKEFPRDIGKGRPCLRYHMKRCSGVCAGKVSREEYTAIIDQCRTLLQGKGRELEKQLEQDMEAYAEALEFEKAAVCRDRLNSIKKLSLKQTVTGMRMSDLDAIAFVTRGTRSCISVLSFGEGNLMNKNITFFDGFGEQDASDVLSGFISQHYPAAQHAPQEICLSHEVEGAEALERLLTGLRRGKCNIVTPKRGERMRQVELAKNNAALELQLLETREQKSRKVLELMQEALSLPNPPERIEAYDISNTAGDEPVASMTVHTGGRASKRDYRKFIIKTAAGGDDYGAMAEVVGRRLDRAINGDEGFLPMPDLMLIDGGQGQVAVARHEIDIRGLDIPAFGMVKDDHHRTRGLMTVDGREIGLSATPALFAFVGRIQEETHNYAIEYHRTRRSKSMRKSTLEDIPGIGESRRKQLMGYFGTLKAIKAASLEELKKAVPADAALSVYRFFRGEEN